MKLNSLITMFASLCLVLLGCGQSSGSESSDETPSAEQAPEGETAENENEGEGEDSEGESEEGESADNGEEETSVCANAIACCEAYVAAMAESTPAISAEQTCASVRRLDDTPGGDTACQNSINGWASAFASASMAVPAACSDHAESEPSTETAEDTDSAEDEAAAEAEAAQ